MGRGNHKCVGHWVVDSIDVGRCLKYQLGTRTCSDSGLRCPYDGVRDFGKLQNKAARLPEWMREKASTTKQESRRLK